MSRNLRGRLLSWSKAPENRRIVKAAGLIIALVILVTGADMACSRIQMILENNSCTSFAEYCRSDTSTEVRTFFFLFPISTSNSSTFFPFPYGIIAYMSLSFSDFMEELYGNVTGIGVMTLCLGIYVGAYYLGVRLLRIDV